jgi:hypothetical protein
MPQTDLLLATTAMEGGSVGYAGATTDRTPMFHRLRLTKQYSWL